MSKKLVAYFSASGVTKKLAEKLAAAVDADLFEIRPKIPYTKADLNWMDKQSRSTIEMQNPSSRPEIAEGGPDLSGYDTIFVGFPIWWYIAPTIVNTFLEGCDLTGKTVVPFATSGGSDIRDSVAELQQLLPKSQFGKSLILQNPNNDKKIQDWLTENGW